MSKEQEDLIEELRNKVFNALGTPRELIESTEASDRLFKMCNGCKYLNIDEHEQNYLRKHTGHIYDHICKKYNKRVCHFPYDEPFIYPCDECMKGDTDEKMDS